MLNALRTRYEEAVIRRFLKINVRQSAALDPNVRTDFFKSITENFHRLYYNNSELTWNNTYWLGTKILKYPGDLIVYQEMLYELRPDIIIECGSRFGGSAYFFATILDLLGHGKVVTIDIEDLPRPEHPRIQYICGSSVDPTVFNSVRRGIQKGHVVLLVLDSDHSKSHVLDEMNLWHELVTVGSYMVVEDSNINGHPVLETFGDGPMEALEDFLRRQDSFVVDSSREKFMLTFNPNGHLKRIK